MQLSTKSLAILSFVAGIGLALLVFTVPGLHRAAVDVEQSGYSGAFVAGILYGINLTAATATAIFFSIPDTFNPWGIALLGGLGAMLYDLTVFSLFRRTAKTHWVATLKEKVPGHRAHWPTWVNYLIGGAIIASPIPDEIGAGWFGTGEITPIRFAAISFLANAGGIVILQFIG